ncbi:PEP-CTERM sorting domain-containing protein [Blastopirellula marina]|uniref:Ice-binding protein C-terminal domain-containing protein n=1 Tax=Blastopirellula marina TaxID=124 RepID=A0A2S8GLX0_9BACT|nr:PEP-CTERM sorting domain-containing protein [Blastopirellula marina]PQO45428.1 hypothetical protein C5Y93_13330 [Blastopirellula marina]
MRILRAIGCFLVTAMYCMPTVAAQLYSTSSMGQKVHAMDPNSGLVAEVASFEELASRGIAFEPGGKLFVTTNLGDYSTLEELDRASGSRLHIGRFDGQSFVQAIDFDYQGNLFALSDAGTLYQLSRDQNGDFVKKEDSDVLEMTPVGETGIANPSDIAIDVVGRIFAVAGNQLYEINPLTAEIRSTNKIVIKSKTEEPQAEEVEPYQVSLVQSVEATFAGLMFDDEGGLFATTNSCPTSLYQVDPSNGEADFVSQTEMCDPYCGDFPPPEFVGAGIGGFYTNTAGGGGSYPWSIGGGIGLPLGGGGGGVGGGGGGAGGGTGSNSGNPSNPGTDPGDTPPVNPVPEPGSFLIFGLGLAGVGAARMYRRRRRGEAS